MPADAAFTSGCWMTISHPLRIRHLATWAWLDRVRAREHDHRPPHEEPPPYACGSGSSIGGTSGVPVMSRVERPRVRNENAQRVLTTIRLAKPIR